jgi:phenylacetate-CoA ligase
MIPFVVRHVTGPLYDRLRFGGRIAAAERELRGTDRATREQLDAIVRERLSALLRHAAAHVPRYSGIPTEPAAFGKLPLLRKGDAGAEVVARDRARPFRERRTSGSLGAPARVLVDVVSLARHRAARRVAWRRLGVLPGDRWTMAWGRDEPRGPLYRALVALAENRQLVRIEDLETDVATERARIDRFDPAVLYGFASGLVRLAEAWPGGRPRGSLRALVSTAEMLPPGDARHVEAAFGVPVVQEYGLTEAQVVATGCEAGSLHVVEENVLVEVIRDGRAAAPGEPGEIVITDLFGYAAPLLRYVTGDSGSFAEGPCPCGRARRRLDLRLARSVELFHVDGRAFHPEVFTLPHGFPHFGKIRRFRARRTGERSFEVDVVLAEGAPEGIVLAAYEAAVREALPVRGLVLRVRSVARIERPASGKLRYFEDARP